MHNGVEFDKPTLDERDQPRERHAGTLKVTDLLVHNVLENIYNMVAPERQQDVGHTLADGLGIPLYHWFSWCAAMVARASLYQCVRIDMSFMTGSFSARATDCVHGSRSNQRENRRLTKGGQVTVDSSKVERHCSNLIAVNQETAREERNISEDRCGDGPARWRK